MKNLAITSLTCLSMVVGGFAGCANMTQTQKDTAMGAGVGAAAGAVIGGVTGGSKGAATGAVLGGVVGAGGGYLWSQKMRNQKTAMEQATAGTPVAVTQTPDNRLKLDIPSDLSFDMGSSVIKPSFTPVLDRFATNLSQHPESTVTIVGHTDSSGSEALNNALSVARAEAVRDYLVSRGIARSRFVTAGRGSREPVADNSTPQGRDKNRRVEVYVGEVVASR
jgi:outer membrane protein OmpA-like peptidoglycan-associated protein